MKLMAPIALAAALALGIVWQTPASSAVIFTATGQLNHTDTYGDAAEIAYLQSILRVSTPTTYGITMTFSENPGWPLQAFILKVGDQVWSGAGTGGLFAHSPSDGVGFSVLVEEYDPAMGSNRTVRFGLTFYGLGIVNDSPPNDANLYLTPPRSYANFSIAGPFGKTFVSSIFLRANPLPGSVTDPTTPVATNVSIDGAFTPRPPPPPVPEPASWAMMIIGFGLAGTGLRRSRALRPALPSPAPAS